MPGPLFDPTFNNLERAMDIATRYQAVIAQNIANANTPGYEAITFDEQLMQAVKRTENPEVVLEEELSSLTENSVAYSSYIKLVSTKFNMLRNIATQGRR
jgi:flagellar basal body rod protein FlgB